MVFLPKQRFSPDSSANTAADKLKAIRIFVSQFRSLYRAVVGGEEVKAGADPKKGEE